MKNKRQRALEEKRDKENPKDCHSKALERIGEHITQAIIRSANFAEQEKLELQRNHSKG